MGQWAWAEVRSEENNTAVLQKTVTWKGQPAVAVVLMEFWRRISKWPWAVYGLNCGFSNGNLAGRLQTCMYVSNTRCWISCVPCKHITNDIIVPDDCQYVRWFRARNVPFHFFDGGGTSLGMEAKGHLCSDGPLERCERCKVRISGSYCLKYRTCELPSPTLRPRKTVQPTLNVMSANGNSSLRVPYPLCKCREGSLRPHAVQVALATDAWGAVQARLASNGFLEDDQHAIKQQTAAATWGSVAGGEAAIGGVRACPGGQRWCATS